MSYEAKYDTLENCGAPTKYLTGFDEYCLQINKTFALEICAAVQQT